MFSLVKHKVTLYVESYFYSSTFYQKIISFLLLPLSAIYCAIVYLKYKTAKVEYFNIPIVSIGNLSVGGSGKTPLITELASYYENSAIILRGYGRKSSGLIVVRDRENILVDVDKSGDEAMIYAQKLPSTIVIVSEKREDAILRAKELGAKVIFLDDAFRHHQIKKLDILIDVKTSNNFCLPSGAYREKLWSGVNAIVISEGVDFTRETSLLNPTKKMCLVTAIARPERLDKYLPTVVEKHYFSDHYYFKEEELKEIMEKSGADSLLVTYKDYVKMSNFDIKLSLLELRLKVDKSLFEKIDMYIKES
ncbi:MAG: tetraacyldisaccharide 4'-kinase [Helicobacteraceae bacterium]|nr:tetraacyldisaccharide 4'-kinase [Helicobacteraceae bacterium]